MATAGMRRWTERACRVCGLDRSTGSRANALLTPSVVTCESITRALLVGCELTQTRSEDSGINPLFERRAEMAIAYTEEMKRDLRRRRNRPDRIIGLSKSRTIERLLWKPDQRQASPYTTVEASIRTTPFKQDGKPVLFPFLIIEAKSEKSGTAFTDIDMQTAFAMRELVLLQEELRRNASGRGYDSWEAGPLVWYFSYRGEQWRLHGAYPRPNGATGAVVCCFPLCSRCD